MAPIRLPCLVVGDCNFQLLLEFVQATADGHMQHAKGMAEAEDGMKPEKFPRLYIKIYSSA